MGISEIKELREEFGAAYGRLQEHYNGLRLKISENGQENEREFEAIASSVEELEGKKQQFEALAKERLKQLEGKTETPQEKEARIRERVTKHWRAKKDVEYADHPAGVRKAALDLLQPGEVEKIMKRLKAEGKL